MWIAYIKGTDVKNGIVLEGIFEEMSNFKHYFKEIESRHEVEFEVSDTFQTLYHFEYPCKDKDITLCVTQVCNLDQEWLPVLCLKS